MKNRMQSHLKAYPSGSFIKNRTNMQEMQNRMKIAFCVKSPLPSILLADKRGPREVFGEGLSWSSASTACWLLPASNCSFILCKKDVGNSIIFKKGVVHKLQLQPFKENVL